MYVHHYCDALKDMALSRFFPCFQFRLEDNINKLDYSNNIFIDGFPHVWQYERTLEELNITSTRIQHLPPQLFYCQGLKVLLANNNNLENIPDAVGSLRQLQQLNLSRNFLTDVPDHIKTCKNLTHLDLSCNSLQKLPGAITCLISLQELILNETCLEFLPANFGRLVNLRIAELRSNNLVSLPKSMQRLVNLQRLDIGCNEFKIMPEVIGELKHLRELWFDFNQIQIVPQQIGKLRELEHFEGNGNCLSCLPNDVGNWFHAEVLSLSMNNLTTFPFNVGMLKSLVTLKCESNILIELPACISNLENLEELVVSHNKLSSLPNTIGMLRKLRYLFADDNNLHELPDEICSCSQLSILSVSGNKLFALPENLGHLTNLKVLNIVENNIATLPVSTLSLVNLTSLWISNNQSQPLIPLQYIDISKKTHLTCFMLPQLGTNENADCLNKRVKQPENGPQNKLIAYKPTTSCASSKRRICFAEEATILHTDQASMQTCENGNYFLLSKTNNYGTKGSTECLEKTMKTGRSVDTKDYLMRSPTPYPKELRLMAKYVQLNQQKSTKVSNSDHASAYLLKSNNDLVKEECKTNCDKYFSLGVDKSNICESYNANVECYSQQLHYRNVEDDQNRKVQTELATINQIPISQSSSKPPPYHIARCFTKKSAQDLTSYEFTRQQKENPNWKASIDNSEFLEKPENYAENDLASSNVIFERQNNFEISQLEQKEQHTKNGNRFDMTESSETVAPVLEHKLGDFADTTDRSHTFQEKRCNKYRTKWLYGAHKNPRVLQANVNWENGPDFDIDILPDKEGIYVVSTVPQSNASQFIHPLDKLLEVEGIDFTNIGIHEARLVLRNARPSISIMLSRK